jgi:outer membrane lipoprotein carrier protein
MLLTLTIHCVVIEFSVKYCLLKKTTDKGNSVIKKPRFLLFLLSASILFAQTAIELPASFRAEFTQTVTSDQKKQIVYRGKINFSSPDHFKWRYVAPSKKEVCSDGKKLLVVDHDLEQVTSYKMEKGLDLSAILKNAKPHRKSVYIAKFGGRNYTIQVNGRQELSRIAYKDDLDNNVLIVFSKMHYGKRGIPESQMTCRYPDSYDRMGW